MEWLGWLTKGRCAIGLLDIIVMFFELGCIALVSLCVSLLFRDK